MVSLLPPGAKEMVDIMFIPVPGPPRDIDVVRLRVLARVKTGVGGPPLLFQLPLTNEVLSSGSGGLFVMMEVVEAR